jgi:uncharacterized membrane protein YkoI
MTPRRVNPQPATRPVIVLAALLVAAIAITLAGMPATAQTSSPRTAVHPERLLTLRDILQQVLPLFPGQVIKSVQTREPDGQPVYRLHILAEAGHIIVVTADARTGRIISARGSGR